MEYEVVMGLEVHVELATKTKIFCSCSTEFGGEANSHICPGCSGMPGALPVMNKQVVEYGIAAALVTNSHINQYCTCLLYTSCAIPWSSPTCPTSLWT